MVTREDSIFIAVRPRVGSDPAPARGSPEGVCELETKVRLVKNPDAIRLAGQTIKQIHLNVVKLAKFRFNLQKNV